MSGGKKGGDSTVGPQSSQNRPAKPPFSITRGPNQVKHGGGNSGGHEVIGGGVGDEV